jgi:DNA-directed RNA polymerase specialized sigma24 family protein
VKGKESIRFGDQAVGTAVAINEELTLAKLAVTGSAKETNERRRYENFQALVMKALQLRRAFREVFILCDIRGYSAGETATILGISEDSVMRRLEKARDEMGLAGEDGAKAIAELVNF